MSECAQKHDYDSLIKMLRFQGDRGADEELGVKVTYFFGVRPELGAEFVGDVLDAEIIGDE